MQTRVGGGDLYGRRFGARRWVATFVALLFLVMVTPRLGAQHPTSALRADQQGPQAALLPELAVLLGRGESSPAANAAHGSFRARPGASQPLPPIKVFILAGQSNMQGHASISTFDAMASDPKTAPLLKQMLDDQGKPKVCRNVWITSIGCLGDAYSDLTEKKGNLTAGFGAPDDKIGPEFTFGLHMEQTLKEPVLLIKTAWGGRSLHTDFRPPSAGPYAWSDYELAQLKERGEDLNKAKAEREQATGVYYREMIAHVRKVLADLDRVVPGYSEKQGYELAGFVWFQGFNDYVSGWTYPKQNQPGGYDLYAELLVHLIRDLRKDLAAPKLPVVIGVMGIDGLRGDKTAPMMHFRAAQRKPAMLEEFQGNVVAVETAPHWDDPLEALHDRLDRLHSELNQRFDRTPDLGEEAKEKQRAEAIAKQFSPQEQKLLKGISNGGYHYLGAAKILAPVGKAFAVEALKLIDAEKAKK